MKEKQIEVVSVDQLVSQQHPYRKLTTLFDFDAITKSAKAHAYAAGAEGYGKHRLLHCLILQFMEDLSDREFERFMAENNAAKWFCGFSLMERTPDFTTLCKFRNSIGTKRMEHLFDEVKRQLQGMGFCAEVFTFVESSALIRVNLKTHKAPTSFERQ